MKVVGIQGFHVGFAPSPALGNASTFIRRREMLLLQLVGEDGTAGWGEAFNSPAAAATVIRTRLASLVLGQPAEDMGRIFNAMLGSLGYDRRGAGMMAISAIDMALHDLAARARGISVARMLGGASRDRMLAYASGPFIAEGDDPYGAYPDAVEALLNRGFRAIKPRVGAAPRLDGAVMREMRRQVGPAVGLMVDINQGYTVGAALESLRHMEEADLLWVEEPLQPEDIGGYQTVAAAARCAIAGGEALGSLAAFRDFLVARTFSVLQPDMAVCGGFTGFRRIAALADAFDVPVMPHVFGSVVNAHAALQMGALLLPRRGGGPAPYPFIEVDVTPNPLLTLLGPMELGADGLMAVPDAPGLGFELSPDRLAPFVTEHWEIAP
ncbi:mandelate racemase/muconate lactonizing enzyme family protein [Falsiroseomonas sp. HW251]|uniref:mandelate racemase/muconate lactonizing enzyme family protein n=1 Tax=Falsiroseomonas sp. HW251 TaxID=3390998 RepID=UPI003D31FA17